MPDATQPTPVVIVLAAGLGRRFNASGGQGHKLEARLKKLSLREHVLRAVQASGLPWHVVEREHILHTAQRGMGDSIATGVAATVQAGAWLILPADLPLIQPDTLRAVAMALKDAKADVVIPTFQGQAGHPVGFGRPCLQDLLTLQGPSGARSVVQAHRSFYCAVSDPGICIDIDTQEDLEKVRAQYVPG